MNHTNRWLPKPRWTTSTLAIGTMFSATVAVAAPVAFDIPKQPLASAIIEFSRQSGRVVTAPAATLQGRSSPEIRGVMEPDDALAILLQGTGLRVSTRPSGAQVIDAPSLKSARKGLQKVLYTPPGDDDPNTTPADGEQLPGSSEPTTPDNLDPAAGLPTARDADELDPIVVTGSHIRGAVAAGANVEVFTREDIDRSGHATVQDFMSTITQNFTGNGGGEDLSEGNLLASNEMVGSAVDLRGLGADSTLVLVNGRRTAASGREGNFTDISVIPQSAIERIEILTDGASGVYGSDAVGGVINFRLRRDYNGAETRLRYGTVTDGNTNEYRLAQTVGRSWGSGIALVNFEHYRRDPLKRGERSFAATLDQRPRGGRDYRDAFGRPGNILDPNTSRPAYAIPENQDGRSLSESDLIPNQINLRDHEPDSYLLPKQTRNSAFLTAEQSIGEAVTIFSEIRYSKRKFFRVLGPITTTALVPSTNPFLVDPFGVGFARVNYNFKDDLGNSRWRGHVRDGAITTGVRLSLSEWRWETYINHANQKSKNDTDTINFLEFSNALADPNPETSYNVFGHGTVNNPATIDRIRGTSTRQASSRSTIVNSTLDGPLFAIGDRSVSIALGADYRKERLSTSFTLPEFSEPFLEKGSQSVYAAFGELYAPLIGSTDGIPFAHTLDASIALRYDRYNTTGSTVNPKFGLRWTPTKGITLNGTYGTSYRAPTIYEMINREEFAAFATMRDPRSPTGTTEVLFLFGTNPDLGPEKSKNWTAGATFEPALLPRFNLKTNYFHIVFRDKIDLPTTDLYGMLARENEFLSLITRNPTAEALNAICNRPDFPYDRSRCVPGLIGAIVDWRTQNLAEVLLQGIDFSASYSIPISRANIALGASATYIMDHKIKQTRSAPAFENVDMLFNPIDLRAKAYTSLSSDGVTATLHAHYTDSYKNTRSTTRPTISSYTTFDLTVALAFDRALRLATKGPFRLTLSAVNLFDKAPPFADIEYGYDSGNADPLGRFLAAEIRVEF